MAASELVPVAWMITPGGEEQQRLERLVPEAKTAAPPVGDGEAPVM
ncbi:hypothetical protein SGLAM104S_05834 [Streptomyces glaucescens]